MVMVRKSARRTPLVPEANAALDTMKYEIAEELGIGVGRNPRSASSQDAEFAGEFTGRVDGPSSTRPYWGSRRPYWGHLSSRDAGAIGGHITQRLIRQAESDL
jgi:hypothetical protein